MKVLLVFGSRTPTTNLMLTCVHVHRLLTLQADGLCHLVRCVPLPHRQGRQPDWSIVAVGYKAVSAGVTVHGELKLGITLNAAAKGQVLDVSFRLLAVHGRAVWSWLMCERELVVFCVSPGEAGAEAVVTEYQTLSWTMDDNDASIASRKPAVSALLHVWKQATGPGFVADTDLVVGHPLANKVGCTVVALYKLKVEDADGSPASAGAGVGAGAGAAEAQHDDDDDDEAGGIVERKRSDDDGRAGAGAGACSEDGHDHTGWTTVHTGAIADRAVLKTVTTMHPGIPTDVFKSAFFREVAALQLLHRKAAEFAAPPNTVVPQLLRYHAAELKIAMQPRGTDICPMFHRDDMQFTCPTDLEMRALVDLLKALHDVGIAHGDVRWPNVLLVPAKDLPPDMKRDGTRLLYLIDFGMAVFEKVQKQVVGGVDVPAGAVPDRLGVLVGWRSHDGTLFQRAKRRDLDAVLTLHLCMRCSDFYDLVKPWLVAPNEVDRPDTRAFL